MSSTKTASGEGSTHDSDPNRAPPGSRHGLGKDPPCRGPSATVLKLFEEIRRKLFRCRPELSQRRKLAWRRISAARRGSGLKFKPRETQSQAGGGEVAAPLCRDVTFATSAASRPCDRGFTPQARFSSPSRRPPRPADIKAGLFLCGPRSPRDILRKISDMRRICWRAETRLQRLGSPNRRPREASGAEASRGRRSLNSSRRRSRCRPRRQSQFCGSVLGASRRGDFLGSFRASQIRYPPRDAVEPA